MIRLGVVGHQGYERLRDLVATLEREAPRLGITTSYEEELISAGDGLLPLGRPDSIDVLMKGKKLAGTKATR